MNRRESLKLITTASLAAGFIWTPGDIKSAHENLKKAKAIDEFEPEFFTPHEFETVRILVDLIIPADDRSGSATDAGVPQFMDFMMLDRPAMQLPMRGGLAWIDYECHTRFEGPFRECTAEQQHSLLGDIAWPEMASPELSQGIAFFNSFRDLTASGFWSSKMGVEDLQYMGNTFVQEWKGCPTEVLDHLGVRYSNS